MTRRLLALPLALCALALVPATAAAESRVSGDFNGDGHDDLAVGVPFEDVGSNLDGGAVNVLYGSSLRLRATDNQFWHQNRPEIVGVAEQDDRFGQSLAAGDFNGDGRDDLAVGVPGESVGSLDEAGAVNVLYGSAVGLRAADNQIWHQDSTGINDAAAGFESFGHSLAAGDFNGSGHDDLAVGVPFEDVGSVLGAGAVNVLYGSNLRLRATDNQFWHQDREGINDAAEQFDHFGLVLAAGDFNGSGHDDLAIAAYLEDVGSIKDAGAVNVLYGSSVRLRATDNQFWHQNSAGIEDAAEHEDRFGWSLSAGDFNGSGHDDLAVGVPFEDIGSIDAAGAVNVLYGSSLRLRETDNQLWHQDSTGINETAEVGDKFGYSVTAGDFNGSGHDDLAVGEVPEEEVGSSNAAGAVNVLYGSSLRLRATDNQFWHQDSTGINDAAEEGDRFGASLSAGDYNGSGHDDLAVGVWGEDVGSIVDAGAVNVLYGSSLRLRATDNQFWHQNRTGIDDAAEHFDSFGFSLPT